MVEQRNASLACGDRSCSRLAAAARSACLGHRRAGARRAAPRRRTSRPGSCCSAPAPQRCASLIEFKHWQLPPKWLRGVLAFVALLGVLLDYRTLNGIDAGTALLIVMAGMKLLETRTVRDLTVLVFLSYFALFAAFLYNQSLLRLPYMLITAWLLTATLMRIHQTTTRCRCARPLAITGKMFLQSLPLAVLLFLLFPRLPGQFWASCRRAARRLPGCRDEMSPGDVSDLSLLQRIAFRVRFDGETPPPPRALLARPVLHDFDGRTWRRPRTPFVQQAVAAERPDVQLRADARAAPAALDLRSRRRRRTGRGRGARASDFQLLAGRTDRDPDFVSPGVRALVQRERTAAELMRQTDTAAARRPQRALDRARARDARARRQRRSVHRSRARQVPRRGILLHAGAAAA